MRFHNINKLCVNIPVLLTPWASSVLFLNTSGNLRSRFEQAEGHWPHSLQSETTHSFGHLT